MKLFDSVQSKRPKLNSFDMSHEKKLSINMGNLVPILCQEVVPGDKIQNNTEMLLRFAPLLAPMMHRVNVFTHFFFVPNRLVWSEWEDFITGGRDGLSAPVHPYILIENTYKANFDISTLADYLGVRLDPATVVVNTLQVNALPFRAYQLIYDEYYRDQNVTAALDILTSSGQVTGAERDKLTTLRKRAWEKDYFTTALPWAQRGTAINMPFTAVVDTLRRKDLANFITSNPGVSVTIDKTAGVATEPLQITDNAALTNVELFGSSSQFNINDLRRSIRLQEWLEKNARGGARYIEQILSHFGVVSSDARLDRPEFLGGGKTPVVVSEVVSTFQDATSPAQGNMAGHGVSVGNTNGFKKFFEEHGFIVGIMSVLPKTEYMQGVPRMFRRSDKFDYYWPELANIGEQEVKVSEIWYDSGAAATQKDETFGYQSRYSEYKQIPSSVHGQFRTTLAYWHMARIFAAKPVLNTAFIESDPTKRIFAVTTPTIDSIYVQLFNNMKALRPMPYFGTPTL